MKNSEQLPYVFHLEQDELMLKDKGVSLCALLDTVRPLSDNKFSVRLRVIHNRIVKLYTTRLKLSISDYKAICGTNGSKEVKAMRKLIHEHLRKAYDSIKSLENFNFNDFDKLLNRKSGESDNLYYHYQIAIEGNRNHNRVGNADSLELSMKSIKEYTGKTEKLVLNTITPKWLNDYEYYMTTDSKDGKRRGRSKTTVGIYLRALRTVFNMAIQSKDISEEKYPFGANKYVIPTGERVKKALNREQIKKLFEAKPRTPEQEKAKDFWFFSYACNGMNIMDIAQLKYGNIDWDNNSFSYVRAKTKNTNITEKKITIYLNDYSRSIINKYGSQDKRKDSLVFSIITDKTSAVVQKSRVKAFTKFINQHMKKLAVTEGLPSAISSYWARHTWATLAMRNGKSVEFLKEAIGHGDIKTTQHYLAGFEDADIREFAENVMKF